MPSAASPELGAAAGTSEALRQVLGVIDKKVRNMEKKKVKLSDYEAKKCKGERLNPDQMEALAKAQEVTHNLEFARDLQRSFVALGLDIQKAAKKASRREQLLRQEQEKRRLQALLEVQRLLGRLGEGAVRQQLRRLLSEPQLAGLDRFFRLVSPAREPGVGLAGRLQEASVHLWELLEAREKAVAGTTYKALKESLDKVLQSGTRNGTCAEEASAEPDEQPAEDEGSTELGPPPAAEVPNAEPRLDQPDRPAFSRPFVNRPPIPEPEPEAGIQNHAPAPLAAPDLVTPPSPAPTLNLAPPTDPGVRKQAVQDLMAQMQGTYNFMQESILEFDGQVLDPAIVSIHAASPALRDMSQMLSSEPRLTPPGAAPIQPQGPQAFVSPPLYQQPHPHGDPAVPTQTSLSPEQPPSKPLHSGGINVNAAPFQSMQAVFNTHAPSAEVESQNLPAPFESSYFPTFSQPPHAMEQPEMQPGSFHPQDHQSISQQAVGLGAGFSRAGQPFFSNSRGGAMSRGTARPARAALNGYRGSSNGFRGSYDGYRAPFPSGVAGGYGPSQFGGRDYNGSNYQRDGYQQNYKRGCSRGNAPTLRS
ncbi:caprin-1-like [Denticeps clupeoides]|uniref:caprin-1-like n=1 Tax=Denticeps clupeoides TaxID=299321 RepID=UPI0010A2C289|nr:caprin-1-like [Denticeps clupeoides]